MLILSLGIMILLNFLLVISFLIGKIFIFKETGDDLAASYFSVYLALLFAAYFISIIAESLFLFLAGHRLFCLPLLFFLLPPFIIGRLVNYKNLNFHTVIQILTLFAGLITGVFVLLQIK